MEQHFETLQWVAYLRGVAAAPHELSAHLDAGCAPCVADHAFCRTLSSTMEEMRQAPAPSLERVLHLPMRRPMASRSRLLLPLFPVFDSFLVGASAALRSNARHSRHTVYELPGIGSLDLMVERGASGSGWSVAGQLLSAAGNGLPGLQVALRDDQQHHWNGLANDQGEFVFPVVTNASGLHLQIQVDENGYEIAPLRVP